MYYTTTVKVCVCDVGVGGGCDRVVEVCDRVVEVGDGVVEVGDS